jgi:hypothetical protein
MDYNSEDKTEISQPMCNKLTVTRHLIKIYNEPVKYRHRSIVLEPKTDVTLLKKTDVKIHGTKISFNCKFYFTRYYLCIFANRNSFYAQKSAGPIK